MAKKNGEVITTYGKNKEILVIGKGNNKDIMGRSEGSKREIMVKW